MTQLHCDKLKLMSVEEMWISFATWQMEQHELEKVKQAIRQADSGRLVPHATVTLFNHPSAPIGRSCERTEASEISWADAVVGELRLMCEYFDRLSDSIVTRQQFLTPIFLTLDLICKHPDIGRSGRIRGTREWDRGFATPTIVYRELLREIQVLGVLASQRKWPHMKPAIV